MSLSEYLNSRSNEIWEAFAQHALAVALTILIAAAIGVSVGALSYRSPRVSGLTIGTTAGFLTIPSVALFGILIQIVGFGWDATLIALVMYSLLPITRNTVVGLRGVDAAIVEAGRGMGMGRTRLMLRVQLPLAWPLILAGIRVATQMIMGIAALAVYANGPGLGHQIYEGLSRLGNANDMNATLTGTVGVVILAILFDLFYFVVRLLTTPRGLRV